MRELDGARFDNLFASPMLAHVWADSAALNAQLREAILAHAHAHPGEQRTNYGGWHSKAGALEFCGAAGQRLIERIRHMTEEATLRLYAAYDRPPPRLSWTLNVWANINRRGDFNEVHTHPGATWSGVYYVDAGQSASEPEATAIHLYDPYPARTNVFFPEISVSNIVIPPEPGLMILFPAYVPHAVPPHRGDGARISIAFNVRKEPFP
jgi:uncharacterized protein (TIGR02466 family)